MDIIIIISVVIFAIWLLSRFLDRDSVDDLGIKGKLVWVDQGKSTKPFFNNEWRVLGKPDLMYKIDNGILAVEYKSRENNIYGSDVVQGLTASLAARGDGYKVIRLLVKTDNSEKYIDLPKSDKSLFKMISKYVDIVRMAKMGKGLPASPERYKCLNCAYSQSCLQRT